MTSPQATDYQLTSLLPSILTCANHPTTIANHKCDKCLKIICLQCYNRWGPNTGLCPQCFETVSRACCNLL